MTEPTTAARVLAAFHDLAGAGCSFQDALLAVYELGEADARGVAPTPRKADKAIPPCPYVKLVEQYHKYLPTLPKVRVDEGTKLWATRKAAMMKVWKWVLTSSRDDGTRRAETAEQGVAWFGDYFERANFNDFLMGRTPRSKEHQNWRADFDFLLTGGGYKQVMERTE
jgi:hypothetical protein